MPSPLRVLFLEDVPTDAELVIAELRRAGFEPEWQRVDTGAAFADALSPALDLILADYSIPGFSALDALELFKTHCLDIPFIIVTGALGDEEAAVHCIKAGATDYLLKDRLARLGKAVTVALDARQLRLQQQQAERILRETQERYTALFQRSADAIYIHDFQGNFLDANPAALKLFGYSRADFPDLKFETILDPADVPRARQLVARISGGDYPRDPSHFIAYTRSGQRLIVETTTSVIEREGRPWAIQGIARDVTARQEADDALRKSEERYRVLSHLVAHIAYVLRAEPNGDLVREWTANGSLVAFLGYEDEVLNPRDLYQFVLDDDQTAFAEHWRCLLDGHSDEREFRIRTRSGSVLWVRAYARPVHDETGRVTHIYGAVRDVTAARVAEETLRETTERYRSIVEMADEGIWQSDARWHTNFVNRRMAEMLGYSIDEMMNRPTSAFMHPDDRQIAQAHFERRQRGIAEQYELRLLRKDGDIFWGLMSASPLHDAGGQFIGAFVMVADITSRKRTEQALRESEERWKAISELVPVTLVISSVPDNKILYVNEMGAERAGLPANDLIGQHIFPHFLDTTHRMHLQAEFNNRGTILNREVPIVEKDGTKGWALVSVRPVLFGGQLAAVAIAQDITQHRQAQEALAKERNLLRKIIDTIPDPISIKDAQGHIIAANIALARTVGMESPEAMIGKTNFDMLPHEHASRLAAEERPVFEDGVSLLNIEEPMIDRYGNAQGWFLFSKVPLRDADGSIMGLAALSRDITERKRAEETEHELRTLAEALADISTTLTSTLDLETVMKRILENVGRVVAHDTVNLMLVYGDAARVVYSLGFDPETTESLMHHSIPLTLPTIQSMLATGKPYVIEDVRKTAAWRVFPETAWVRSCVAAPIRIRNTTMGFLHLDSSTPGFFDQQDAERLSVFADHAGIALENAQLYSQIQAHAADLERRVVERTAELREAKERAETILRQVNDGIVVAGPDGVIEQVNPAFEDLFDMDRATAIGRRIDSLIDAEDRPRLAKSIEPVTDSDTRDRLEVVYVRSDGSTFDADVALAQVRGDMDRPGSVVYSIRDITRRKQAEQDLRQALDKERELGEIKMRFVSMVSHEFRTPLAIVQTSADLVKHYGERLSPERRDEHLHEIQLQLWHMSDMLEDFLTISRTEPTKVSFRPESVDLYQFVRDIVEHQQAIATDHQIVYHAPDIRDEWVIDHKLIRQAVSNLISNAVKYSRTGSRVWLDLECTPASATFTVRDEGIGIPPEDQARLFEVFHRASNVGGTAGTGIGLAVVRRAVEAHGGTVTFNSILDSGTTFTIELPRIEHRMDSDT